MALTTTIRMYNQQNLGDCFLLKFKAADDKEVFILIDFGSYHSNKERERVIAADIRDTVKGKPFTIVLTHQHKDHISGFGSSADLLEGLASQLWLSFLDNEQSKEGKLIRGMTEKYWQKSAKTKKILLENFGDVPEVTSMLNAKEGYDLFAEQQTGGKSMTALLGLVGRNVNYLTPGDSFFLPGTEDGVKVYVLGPPFSRELMTKMDPNHEEEVNGLNALMDLANMDVSATLMLNALDSMKEENNELIEPNFPFNSRYVESEPAKSNVAKCYEEESWRKIDYDWLSEVGRLSLHMDNLTNNTSLVLAFELVESKKVLLFVGDAQIGNWKSWFDVKFKDGTTAEDLLARTVVYKAGHHSSHNATLKQGLDLMNEKELVVLVPVDKTVSDKHQFAMLKAGMIKGYNRKSHGRVLRSDTIEQSGENLQVTYPFLTREEFGEALKINPDTDGGHLSIDFTIGG